MPDPLDVLYMPDVNVLVHAAETLHDAWDGTPEEERTEASMLTIFERSKDDALHDLRNATVTGRLVSSGLLSSTAVHVLCRKHGMSTDEAAQLLGTINFNGIDAEVSHWDQICDQALGETYDHVWAHAAEHVADINSDGALLDKSDRRVDGEDLGVFTVISIVKERYDCPVTLGSADREACAAAEKAGIAETAHYRYSREDSRMHATPGAARPAKPDKFSPKRSIKLPTFKSSIASALMARSA